MDRKPRSGPAPRVFVKPLTPGQARALTAHLRLKLPPAEAARLFAAIEHWFDLGGLGANPEAQEWSANQHRHMSEVARQARALQESLRIQPPLWKTSGIDWSEVDALLERVSCSAEAEAPAPEPTKGAPPVKWRDGLIALVHAHYPADKLTVSWCSHFEETLRMLLGFLGEDLEDLHAQIRRTLKRQPAAPFNLVLD